MKLFLSVLMTGVAFSSIAQAQFDFSGGNTALAGKSEGCFYLRSLNNNYQQNKRFLDGASDGKTVKLVDGLSHGTIWNILKATEGYVLRSMNKNYQNSPYYIDAESNGETVKLQNGVSHGVYWDMIGNLDRAQFQSKNKNHKNYLDGASDGQTAKLASGASHGTYWQLQSVDCPY